MSFNSLQFLLFFSVVVLWYFLLKPKHRWKLLLCASCLFYMAFKPFYILILFFTIGIDYVAGIYIERSTGSKRKLLLVLSIISNLGVLAVFKYYSFIETNFALLFTFLHQSSPLPLLNIILPIGLSFHTFQAMSYTIEVYRGNQPAEKRLGIYALYVMFFPQLVAGPIERPQNLIHQFYEVKGWDFERIKAGLTRMAFGFLKKVVIADRLAVLVSDSYTHIEQHNGLSILLSTLAFTFQIYFDFSAYTDIALGAAQVLGFNLMENFRRPYSATSIAEFWNRWHISLSSWFRDYVYIPLGGNRLSRWRWGLNIMLVFVLSGLWHGASWKYVVWGGLHGTYIIVAMIKNQLFARAGLKTRKNFITQTINQAITFALVAFAWIFFRAGNFNEALIAIDKIFHLAAGNVLHFSFNLIEIVFTCTMVLLVLLKEKHFDTMPTSNTKWFATIFGSLVALCYLFGYFNANQFIYFQF